MSRFTLWLVVAAFANGVAVGAALTMTLVHRHVRHWKQAFIGGYEGQPFCRTCGHNYLPGMTSCPKCDPPY